MQDIATSVGEEEEDDEKEGRRGAGRAGGSRASPGRQGQLPGGDVGKAGCPPSCTRALRNAELLSAWSFLASLFYVSLQESFSKLANR